MAFALHRLTDCRCRSLYSSLLMTAAAAAALFALPPRPPPRFVHLQRLRCTPAAAAAEAAVPPLRVAFACGGSGSHVYSAIAIADDLQVARPSSQTLFLGSNLGLESTAVPDAGHSFAPIPPNPSSFFHSILLLRRFRPAIVVSTGGPLTLAVLLAAALLRVTIVIQVQNSVPSLAHRLITPFAAKFFLAFNACVRHFPKHKCAVYGNPVRASIRALVDRFAARAHFFSHFKDREVEAGSTEVVLVLGGSFGAPALNIAMLNLYYVMLTARKDRYIIWQTGPEWFCEMECLVKSSKRLLLTPYLHEMDMAYAAADIVVSRAGAMTCTEILATGKPAILVPSPTSEDDHETRNAYIMADVAGAKVLTEDELDSSSLQYAIDELLGDKSLMEDMSEKALNAARPNASVNIVKCILSLVDKSPSK